MIIYCCDNMYGSDLAYLEERGHCLDEQSHYALLGEHVDVGSAANEAVEVLGRAEVEVDVHPVHHIFSYYAVHHLRLQPCPLVVPPVSRHPCRVPGHIAVLGATEQDNLLEVTQVAQLT